MKDSTSDGDLLALDHSRALANKRCHEKLDFYLHRPIVEYIVIFLIIVDAILVTASLLIEVKIIEAEASTTPHGVTTTTSSHAESTAHGNSEVTHLENVAKILHYTSLSILFLFLVEVFLKLFGQRENFFKSKIQVADSFIVAISFALDIAVIILEDVDSTAIQGMGLIIILRMWRLVRIVNGAVVATKDALNEKLHEEKRQLMRAKEQITQLEAQVDDKNREIEFLKGRLSRYEPIEMIPTGSTRLPAYLPETKEFPKQVLGDVTDDEDYNRMANNFTDLHRAGGAIRSRPALNYTGTAFQAYQPGVTYQPTSQYPADQIRSHSATNQPAVSYGRQPNNGYGDSPGRYAAGDLHTNDDYHENEMVDTADESDVVSIKPPKSRSGNTFTVKKDGVPMTSL